MKVLWFEVTVPKIYSSHDFHGAGWQDALESIVKEYKNIELGIAFESKDDSNEKQIIEGVHYFPLVTQYSFVDKIRDKSSWDVSRNKIIPLSLKVIEEFKPDIIYVFGSEWCFGQVAEYTKTPVIIHMQGSIPPYNNAFYPPGYNELVELIYNFTHFKWKALVTLPMTWKKQKSWKKQEERTLKTVNNYIGRTEWDKGLIKLYHPDANYFYCSEALRSSFIDNDKVWVPTKNIKLRLTSIGCSSLWKGLDTIIRTAKLLKERNIEFEWCLVGETNYYKKLVEWKEKIKMEDINILLMGELNAGALHELLMHTDIYVHTAYIENSPNSICEAQYIGLPIIATYVGGIPSLLENRLEGLLIPANDPFTLANEIIKLSSDKESQIEYSTNSRKRAHVRHNPHSILHDLLGVYNQLVK